jgi:hypothetical protein
VAILLPLKIFNSFLKGYKPTKNDPSVLADNLPYNKSSKIPAYLQPTSLYFLIITGA